MNIYYLASFFILGTLGGLILGFAIAETIWLKRFDRLKEGFKKSLTQ